MATLGHHKRGAGLNRKQGRDEEEDASDNEVQGYRVLTSPGLNTMPAPGAVILTDLRDLRGWHRPISLSRHDRCSGFFRWDTLQRKTTSGPLPSFGLVVLTQGKKRDTSIVCLEQERGRATPTPPLPLGTYVCLPAMPSSPAKANPNVLINWPLQPPQPAYSERSLGAV